MTDANEPRPSLPASENPPARFASGVITSVPLPEKVPQNSFNRSAGAVKTLSDREWVAVWFAVSLLALIFLTTLTLLWQWLLPVPKLSAGSAQTTPIDNYKALTALVDERTGRFFDLTVTKTLLPVFTTIVGFLLGRRSKED